VIEVQPAKDQLATNEWDSCWCMCEYCTRDGMPERPEDAVGMRRCPYKIMSDDEDEVYCNFCRSNCESGHRFLWPRQIGFPAKQQEMLDDWAARSKATTVMHGSRQISL
jgi:hypothetical protein